MWFWNYVDDWGKEEFDEDVIAHQADAVNGKRYHSPIREVIHRLIGTGCLVVYEVKGKKYCKVPNLRKHQHPQHPCKDTIPEPPEQALTEDSLSPHIPLTRERSVVERRVEEGSIRAAEPVPLDLPLPGLPPPVAKEILLSFPCKPTAKGKPTSFDVTPTVLQDWTVEFPGVDILSVLQSTQRWIEANEPKPRNWKGMELWLKDVWLKNAANRGVKHERLTAEEIEYAKQCDEERRTTRTPESIRDPGRWVRQAIANQKATLRVDANGVNREAASGGAVDGGGTAGVVQDGPGVEYGPADRGPGREGAV
jgi:hypothetical protein